MTLAAMLLLMAAAEAKTLIVYYSFTNNTHAIATDMQSQLPDADLLRIEPAEKGLDYAANGYAIGSALISAIRANPDDPDSYPAIDPVSVDFSTYDDIVVATPLYYFGMSAQIKRVVDRFYAINGKIKGHPKKTAFMMTYADTSEKEAEPMLTHFRTLADYLGWQNVGEVVAAGVWTAGSVKNTKYAAQAYELGKRV